MAAGGPRARMRATLVQDFVGRVELVVPLQHDGVRSVAHERVVKQGQRLIRHRMRMRIGEQRLPQEGFAGGDAAREVHFPDQSGRQGIEKEPR